MSDLQINNVDPRIASFRSELSSKHDGLMADAKAQGRVSGSTNAPQVSQEEPYPFEMELRANYQQHVAELSQLAQPLLEGYHAEYSRVEQNLGRTDSEWKALEAGARADLEHNTEERRVRTNEYRSRVRCIQMPLTSPAANGGCGMESGRLHPKDY